MAIIVLLKSVAVDEVKLVEAHDTSMKDIRTKIKWRNSRECVSKFICKILIPILDACYNFDSSNLFSLFCSKLLELSSLFIERLQDSI